MQLSIFVLAGGILLGIFAGLLPGLHPNSVGAVLIDSIGGEGVGIALVIVLGIYSALAFLPSIFLGVPEGETQIALLPGQRMLKEGRGLEAAGVVASSVVFASVLAAGLGMVLAGELENLFFLIKPWIGYVLIFAVFGLLAHEKKIGKILRGAGVFFIAFLLGFIVLDLHMGQPLFALFVGFFTMPAILSSRKFPKIAKRGKEDFSFSFLPFAAAGVLLGAVADFLPGVSTPAQLAVFSSAFLRVQKARDFLAHVAAIEASHNVFAIFTAATAGVARVGSIAIAHSSLGINMDNLSLLVGLFLAALGLGAFLLIRLSGAALQKMEGVDMGRISMLLAIYLVIMVFLVDGILGLFVLGTATSVGFLPRLWGVSRTHVMGSLIGPSILHAFLI